MKRLSSSPGIQAGTSCLTAVDDEKTIEISVKTRASQVIAPMEKRRRIMAFVLTNGSNNQKNKPIPGLAYNNRNNNVFVRY